MDATRSWRSTVSLLMPPYQECQAIPFDLAAAQIPPGALGILDTSGVSVGDRLRLASAAVGFRRNIPTAHLVLRVPERCSPLVLWEISTLIRLGATAIVGAAEPLVAAARRQLTAPIEVSRQIIDFLTLRGFVPPQSVSSYLDEIFSHDAMQAAVRAAGRATGSRTLRGHLQALGLPPPTRWRQLARALVAAWHLQKDPALSGAQVAVECGYADQPGMVRGFRVQFGVTPTAVKERVGWYWLLEAWLARTGRPTSSQSPGI